MVANHKPSDTAGTVLSFLRSFEEKTIWNESFSAPQSSNSHHILKSFPAGSCTVLAFIYLLCHLWMQRTLEPCSNDNLYLYWSVWAQNPLAQVSKHWSGCIQWKAQSKWHLQYINIKTSVLLLLRCGRDSHNVRLFDSVFEMAPQRNVTILTLIIWVSFYMCMYNYDFDML